MTWDIQVLPRAEKALKKLDKPQARRIRIILDIRRSEVVIVAVDLGHRSEIYSAR